MEEYTYYYNECHECGSLRRYTDEESKKEICPYCGGKLVDSGKVLTEQERRAQEKEWRKNHEQELYEQYVKGNAEREEKYAARVEKQKREYQQMIAKIQESYRREAIEKANRLHCPRCGSVNIGKAHYMLPTGSSYMCIYKHCCNNCGYKWDI